MPTVLVTGASRGIGKSIVNYLAADGWDVIGGVRDGAGAQALSAQPRVSAVTLDVNVVGQLAATRAVLSAAARVARPNRVHFQCEWEAVDPDAGCLRCVEVRARGGRRHGSRDNGAAPRSLQQKRCGHAEVDSDVAAPGRRPEKVAKVVHEALTARRPRPRYPVGVGTAMQMALVTKLPTRARDAVPGRLLGRP